MLARLHQQVVSVETTALVVSPHVSVASTVNVSPSHLQQQQSHRPTALLQLSLQQSQPPMTVASTPQQPSPLLSPSLGRLGSIHPPSLPSPLRSPGRSPVKHVTLPAGATTTPLGIPKSGKQDGMETVFFPESQSLPSPNRTVEEVTEPEINADTEHLPLSSQSEVAVQEAQSTLSAVSHNIAGCTFVEMFLKVN